ncbi:hypothetical protein L6452_42621 [Arctium lappa]|uniref:Uncharacterized protein n=1 Tax=Arctium lappa TaxID=4217 RepID=A0ACB8XIQ2_ARCLA|nr:hypothetical protein L6452_42621 [Arctium lappa]
MPQVDTETIAPVAGDGDRKIGCETPEDEEYKAAVDPDIPDSSEFVPPESFWLSKDSEFDWFDRNAFLERKESTKASNSKNLNPSVNPTYSNSNSQRFSVNLKSKAAILGLPKTQRNTHVDSKYRQCKPANIRLFPKRSSSGGRAPGAVPVTEPSSPKVSCIGRVRSKRCRSRRRSSAAAATRSEKPVAVIQPEKTGKGPKTGIISRITSLFRSEGSRRRKNNKSSVKFNELHLENSGSRRSSVTVKPVNSEPATPSAPPALGGMNRFASGRRSESWTDDIDVAGRRSTS